MWQQNLHAIANEPTKLANFAIYFAHIISALFRSLTRSIVSRKVFPLFFKIDFKKCLASGNLKIVRQRGEFLK